MDVCIPNIGPRERRRRLLVGFAMCGLAIAAALWLLGSGAARPWRALVWLPLLVGSIGLLQVRAKTCVALAARGLRNMDAGDEPITDPAELHTIKGQARAVNLQAVVIATAVTLVLLALP